MAIGGPIPDALPSACRVVLVQDTTPQFAPQLLGASAFLIAGPKPG